MPRVKAIKFAHDSTKRTCRGSLGSNAIGDGALLGPDQNGLPFLSL
jgi:hypothetical protein